MKRFIIILGLFIICFGKLPAQNGDKAFRLTIPQTSTKNISLYNKIEFLDSRSDYEFNNIKINNIGFTNQLNLLLNKLIDESAQNFTLFLQLRNLGIYKDHEGNNIHLRMSLYEKNSEDYYFINTFDYKIPIKKIDEYEDLVSEAISNFIADNLNSLEITSETTAYTRDNVSNISYFEKDGLKAYNTHLLTDGIYTTHQDFINQTPLDKDFKPNFKKRELKDLKVITAYNKEQKISPKDIFAVVINGQLYISKDKKYIQPYKDNDDFYFEDEISENSLGVSPAFSIGIGSGGYRRAGIGIGISTVSHKKNVVFKVDHLSNIFIPQ